MNDDVLEAVRDSLADVHMDRPLAEISVRARTHRRGRRAAMAAAAGLVLVVAAALGTTVLRPAGVQGGGPPPAAATTTAERLEFASFTLTRSSRDVVTVTFKDVAADPGEVQNALRHAGVVAYVRATTGSCRNLGLQRAKVPDVPRFADLRMKPLRVDLYPALIPQGVGISIIMIIREKAVGAVAFSAVRILPGGAEPPACL